MIKPEIARVIKEIIEDHVELADESLAKFILSCFMDRRSTSGRMSSNYITDGLIAIAEKALGGVQTVVDIITRDEKYFRWESMDKLNNQIANATGYSYQPNYTEFHALVCMLERYLKTKGEKINLDIDFAISNMYGNILSKKDMITKGIYPINFYTSGGSETLKLGDNGLYKDGYIGIAVSKDRYPQAINCNKEKHIILVDESGKSDLDTIDFSHVSSYESTETTYEFSNPGIVYVPVNSKLFGKLSYHAPLFTILPKHILEKYNLPTMEI